jgi:UDP-N-acetylglucosamine diphosphorylase/glucosamine-1-phosphate N-acetyltransferase
MSESAVHDFMYHQYTGEHTVTHSEINILKNLWQIFQENEKNLQEDFAVITKGKQSQELSATNRIIGKNIFIEEGAKLEHCILNTGTGPIYIGKEAEIMEGSMIRGGLALCDHAQIKMGAKIYGATTIGPYCKVGGEINNSVLFGYSNKAHDGFLGNAVLGEWCNVGADTNNSNLKNNYEPVKLWSYESKRFEKTGTNFCGLIMGDHAKCGINTMFNTGTVVGVGANIFGDGYPRQFIPDFAWGGASGFSTFHIDKFFETAEIVLSRRNKTLDQAMRNMLTQVYEQTLPFRHWEKSQ